MNDTLRYTISGMLASGTDRDDDRISGILLAVNELTGENWHLIYTGSIWYAINYKNDDRIDAARSMDSLFDDLDQDE